MFSQSYGKHKSVSLALILLALIIASLFLRFSWLDWDQGYALHPDERVLTLVTGKIALPGGLSEYLDTQNSSFNPRKQVQPYVYGDLPVGLARIALDSLQWYCEDRDTAVCVDSNGEHRDWISSHEITIVGRYLSALFGFATLFLITLLGREVFGRVAAVVALGFGVSNVFLIQQAHFFTVDGFALFFTTAAMLFFVRAAKSGQHRQLIWAGIAVGLSVACKINLLALLGLGILSSLAIGINRSDYRFMHWMLGMAVTIIASVATFRLAMPGAYTNGFKLDPQWIVDIRWAIDLGSPDSLYPPGVQWTGRTPWLFSLKDMIFWGLGLGTAMAALSGWVSVGYRFLARRFSRSRQKQTLTLWLKAISSPVMILWIWVAAYFFMFGGLQVQAMRYYLPMYPPLIVLAGGFVACLWRKPVDVKYPLLRRLFVMLSVLCSVGWTLAYVSIYQQEHPRITASGWIEKELPADAHIGVDYWDDALPLGSTIMQNRLMFDHYAEATEKKRQGLVQWLESVDHIVLSSNRLYTSIPRQPLRFPLSTEYYRVLFSGELGFIPVADFNSYPKLLFWEFPDQEMGDASRWGHDLDPGRLPKLRAIHFPPADESFSVYDHPRVLVFTKTAAFNPDKAIQIFSSINLQTGLQHLSPGAEARAPTALQLSRSEFQAAQESGTWSDMFNRADFINRFPAVSVIALYLFVSFLGWFLWPLAFVLMPGLADRGWMMSRIFGLLLVAGCSWWLASIRLIKYSITNIYACAAVVLILSLFVAHAQMANLKAVVRSQWRAMLGGELMFLCIFAFALAVRASNPDLWHPWFGGEKPFDFAILNTVLKSESFPPSDPFFAGGYLNYYYFGFVLVALPLKLIGIAPESGYQVSMALFYALAAGAIYSLGYTLAGGRTKAIYAALLAVFFVLLIGNLGNAYLIAEHISGLLASSSSVSAAIQQLWGSVSFGFQEYKWFWDATRIIQLSGEHALITEFPVFTLIYGDLHAHFLAMPLAFMALGFALSWWRKPPLLVSGSTINTADCFSLAFTGIVAGSLLMTNSWDFPTYTALLVLALLVGALFSTREHALFSVAIGSMIFITTMLAFSYPFRAAFATGYTDIGWWSGSRTPLLFYLLIHGIFLLPISSLLWVEHRASPSSYHIARVIQIPGYLQLPFWFVGAAIGVIAIFGISYYLPVLIVVLPVAWLSVSMAMQADLSNEKRAWAVLVLCASCITLMVELLALKYDVGRMNTVFKFYYQVWGLWGVCAAIACVELWNTGRKTWMFRTWKFVVVITIGGGIVYTLTAMPAHRMQRMDPSNGAGLDGSAFMKNALLEENGVSFSLQWDHDAIRWLQENVAGSPVIAEGRSEREYQWGNRVSAHTGLPTIIGWRNHALQSRSILPPQVVEVRIQDVDRFFQDNSSRAALEIIRRYDVSLIYIGALERAYYSEDGLGKFGQMEKSGHIRMIYQNPGVDLYRVVNSGG